MDDHSHKYCNLFSCLTLICRFRRLWVLSIYDVVDFAALRVAAVAAVIFGVLASMVLSISLMSLISELPPALGTQPPPSYPCPTWPSRNGGNPHRAAGEATSSCSASNRSPPPPRETLTLICSKWSPSPTPASPRNSHGVSSSRS